MRRSKNDCDAPSDAVHLSSGRIVYGESYANKSQNMSSLMQREWPGEDVG